MLSGKDTVTSPHIMTRGWQLDVIWERHCHFSTYHEERMAVGCYLGKTLSLLHIMREDGRYHEERMAVGCYLGKTLSLFHIS